MANNQVSPEVWNELEKKYLALAQEEVKERERAGLIVNLDALEKKYLALALQEVKHLPGMRGN